MPHILGSVTDYLVGRRKEFTERVLATFRDGTKALITRVLAAGEDRNEFIRVAVEKELLRRARLQKRISAENDVLKNKKPPNAAQSNP